MFEICNVIIMLVKNISNIMIKIYESERYGSIRELYLNIDEIRPLIKQLKDILFEIQEGNHDKSKV